MNYLKIVIFFSVLSNYSIAQNLAFGPDVYLRASKSTPSEWIFTKGIGVDLVKFSSNRFFYQTGLAYLNNYRVYNNPTSVYRNLFGQFTEIKVRKRSYNFNYLATPLTANFLVFKKPGINLLLSAGGELSWLYRSKFVYETIDGNSYKIIGGHNLSDSNINFNIQGGIGVYIPFSKRLSFIARTHFIKVIKESDENKDVEPGYLGLNFHLLRKL